MKVRKLVKILAVATILAVAVVSIAPKHKAVAATPSTTSAPTTASSDVDYKYVAQPGDSYTVIARKAVQTYGLKYKVKLSGAQIVYAETNLTQQAKSPQINEGKHISISESKLKQWVDSAGKLTKAQLAAWNYYVQFVNFNTSAVGQPAK